MKKILFITAFPPNNRTAGQNYSKNLIKELSKIYIVDIISFKYKNHIFENFYSKNVNYIMKVNNNIFNKIIGFLKIPLFFPLFSVRFSFKVLFYIINKRQYYDYFYFDFSQVFIYNIFLKEEKRFLMVHDVIIQKYNRLKKNYILNFWVYISEKIILKNNKNIIICFSKKDADLLEEKYCVKSKIVSFYIEEKIKKLDIVEIEDYYCFYGAWDRQENLESLEWFEKHLETKYKIKIIGGGIKEEYKEKLINKGFEVLGFINDPYQVLSKSRGLIAPLFNGAGVKVKVIESLACGTPVIGTEVALEGIDFESKLIFKIKTFNEILNAFKYLNEISIFDKRMLKESFLKYYSNNKFIDIIKLY